MVYNVNYFLFTVELSFWRFMISAMGVHHSNLGQRCGFRRVERFAWRILLVALTCLPLVGRGAESDWKAILAWLPEDTETFIVTPDASRVVLPDVKSSASATPAELVAVLPAFNQALVVPGAKARYLVEGSRNFSPPGGRIFIGEYHYEGCHLAQFDAADEPLLRKAFANFVRHADRQTELAGESVAVLKTKNAYDDETTAYVCHPREGLLMTATHSGYLEETLRRMHQGTPKRALPADLAEWKYIDSKALVFGLRHYQLSTAKTDPSSPLGAGVGQLPDPAAVGFVFWVNPAQPKIVQIRYLSDAAHTLLQVRQVWGEAAAILRQAESGPVAGSVDLGAGEESAVLGMLTLMWFLGHGANL